MISQNTSRNVQVNAAESSQFTISDNAKIFKILIDGLYENKEESITREIWSNALDSHVLAGCAERPFDVSFPNSFDPTFRVRDYGVGLTHDEVMNLYTDLGTSTKENTNEATGKFGIGSKSPFAYTDNFTVTSHKDGVSRFYSAMIGSDGVPAIHLLGTQESDEQNGVEVSFPVVKADVNAFSRAAKRVSHGFDVKPSVPSQPGFSWPAFDVLLSGEGWRLLNGVIDGFSSTAYARMGPVLYPINANALDDLEEVHRELLRKTLIIDFEMGDLEITASREALSYGRDEPTADSIKEALKRIEVEMVEKFREEIFGAPTYYKACVATRRMERNGALPYKIRDELSRGVSWNGMQTANRIKTVFSGGWSASYFDHSRRRHKQYRFQSQYTQDIPAYENLTIYVEDLTECRKFRKAATRIKLNEERTASEAFLWVKVFSTRGITQDMIRFFDMYDGARIIMVSDLDEPERSSEQYKTRSPRRPVQARAYDGYNFDTRAELTEEDMKSGGIYIPLKRNTNADPFFGVSTIRLIDLLYQVGAISRETKVFGVPHTLRKQFAGSQWVTLRSFATKWFQSLTFNFVDMIADQTAASRARNDYSFPRCLEALDCAELDEDSVVRKLKNFQDEIHGLTDFDARSYRLIARALDQYFPDDDPDVQDHVFVSTADFLTSEIKEAYPMLSLIPDYLSCDEENVDTLRSYVINCDISRKESQPILSAA
jgi:hypothetical protein